MIAFAAGDAIGWPQERPSRSVSDPEPSVRLQQWERRAGSRFQPFVETIESGQYSDDTQLMLSVSRARLSAHDWNQYLALRELPFFHTYERGAGRSVLRACASWRRGRPPWLGPEDSVRPYFETGANGAAMRSLPHAIWWAGLPESSALSLDVFRDSILTHGHARAHVGAILYATAAARLLRFSETLSYGELFGSLLEDDAWARLPHGIADGWLAAHDAINGPYQRVWAQTVDETKTMLALASAGLHRGALADDAAVLTQLGCVGPMNGSGTSTSVGAIYLASRHAAQPHAAVLTAAFTRGADTDTLAAMTGGLVGAIGGTSWMPVEWLGVQDAEALAAFAQRLVEHKCRVAPWEPFDDAALARFFDELQQRHSSGPLKLDGHSQATLLSMQHARFHERDVADVWTLKLEDGQTIYPRRYRSKQEKSSDGSGQPRPRRNARESPPTVRHVRIPVTRLPLMIEFYERGLGLKPKKEDNDVVSFGAFVLSAQPGDREAVATAEQNRCVIAVELLDIDEVAERLRAMGGREVARSSEDLEQRWVRIRDPENNTIELWEPPPRRNQ
jgi:ADP-ribosylglycohydrolase/predicted enzyme related to lactoylglutathione lyase